MKKTNTTTRGDENNGDLKKRKMEQEYNVKDKYPRMQETLTLLQRGNNQGQKFNEYARLNAVRSQILLDIKKR